MDNQKDHVRGIERVKNPDGMEDDVLVEDIGGNRWHQPESAYRQRGHRPAVEGLPWREPKKDPP